MDKKNVKKVDFATEVCRSTGLSFSQSSEIVDMFFDVLSEGIALNDEVKIMGFGTFCVKDKKERMGRNPKTGEAALIEARKVISFHPAKGFKDTLQS